MLTIIHGDNTVAARNKLNEILGSVQNVVRFSAKKDSIQDMLTGFDSGELFGGQRAVVIDGLFSLKGKNQEKLFTEIIAREAESDFVLFQETIITKTNLSKFKNARVYGFELPKYFFQFLDSVIPGNSIKTLELFHNMNSEDGEQLFYSLVKRVRQLLMLKSGNSQEFQELLKMGDWQLGKLNSQARAWTVKELANFYTELFNLEVNMKSGGLSMKLPNHLDIVIARALH